METASFPDWGRFTPEYAAAELPRLLSESEAAVTALEAAAPTTYEGLVWALDDATRGLYRAWGQVGHLTSVMNSDAWRKVEEDFQPQVVAFSLRVGQSQPLYRAAKAVLAHADGLAPVRVRILAKMVESAELAGVGLVGERKARFNEIQAALAKLAMDFSNAVLDATKAFRFEKDGKTYTIDDAHYPETMRDCADRGVREALCRARATRAPENAARISEILKLRAELAALLGFTSYADLSLQTKCAPSVAAALRMIDDLDAATAEPAKTEAAELLASAQSQDPGQPQKPNEPLGFARTQKPNGPQAKEADASAAIQPWDIAFLAERLRERKYAYSEEELKRHFELEDVLRGLFKISHLLFGIDVAEVTGVAKPSVWHPDVRFFAVKEKGETIAHFYFDPFVRNGQKNGGAWMNEFRNRNTRKNEEGKRKKCGIDSDSPVLSNTKEGLGNRTSSLFPLPSSFSQAPLALVCTNFPRPDANGKCLLPFREVETLFHEFGHALQCMLTRVDEEDAAGINLVEWDAVEVASQFMENWCLDDRTGIAVPAELKAKVRAAKNFRAASACRRQLAFAKTDLLLHDPSRIRRGQTPPNSWGQTPENWGQTPPEARGQTPDVGGLSPREMSENDVKSDVFAHFGVPMVEGDRFLCSFSHIFAGGYAAGYYGYKWAEVMSADCYGAFEEAGLADDAAVRRVGAAYRETVLALGGSQSAIEVFRAFRGRDPEIAALLRQQGLA